MRISAGDENQAHTRVKPFSTGVPKSALHGFKIASFPEGTPGYLRVIDG